MRGTAYSKKKPWRRFKKDGSPDRLIRKICCSILVLEAAFFISRSSLGVLSVERTQREWLSAAPGGQGETQLSDNWQGVLERIFGIRLRLRDGAIEFYRQEDIRKKEN